MKKFILTLGVSVSIVTPLTAVIACSNSNTKNVKKEPSKQDEGDLFANILKNGILSYSIEELRELLPKLISNEFVLSQIAGNNQELRTKIKGIDVEKVISTIRAIKTKGIASFSDVDIENIRNLITNFIPQKNVDAFSNVLDFSFKALKTGITNQVNTKEKLFILLKSFGVDFPETAKPLIGKFTFEGFDGIDSFTTTIVELIKPLLEKELGNNALTIIDAIKKVLVETNFKPINKVELGEIYTNQWDLTNNVVNVDPNDIDLLNAWDTTTSNSGMIAKLNKLKDFMATDGYKAKTQEDKDKYIANEKELEKEIKFYNKVLKPIFDNNETYTMIDVPLLAKKGIFKSTEEELKKDFVLIRDALINFKFNKVNLIEIINPLKIDNDIKSSILNILNNDIFDKVISLNFDTITGVFYKLINSSFTNLNATEIKGIIPIVNMLLAFSGESKKIEDISIPEIQFILDFLEKGLDNSIGGEGKKNLKSLLGKILAIALKNTNLVGLINGVLFGGTN